MTPDPNAAPLIAGCIELKPVLSSPQPDNENVDAAHAPPESDLKPCT
jgi:hypothetical protein